jgi:lipopolysaccharide transport system ATP-binding protein
VKDIAIRIENLSKRYQIGKEKDGSLRGTLSALAKGGKGNVEEFWALKDISLEIKRGDVVGIIGKNGAGKSTLLKILSQITRPTTGRIEINGRVASLLEVGTGFHPELTGRENIYLNGTILGMTRKEVKAKFDEIVSFSGVEKFIDTPVKHYSSGMYVRLAFSVAAHLEPEILIIDEVLAVGDLEFQNKCLGKMDDVAKDGRTVIFVSHDTEALSTLCKNGVLLNSGLIKQVGDIKEVLNTYHSKYQDAFVEYNDSNRPKDDFVALNQVEIVTRNGEQKYDADLTEEFGIRIRYTILKDGFKPCPNVHFYTSSGVYCFAFVFNTPESFEPGNYEAVCWIPKDLLNNITYNIGVAFTTMKSQHIHFYQKDLLQIEIMERKSSRLHDWGGGFLGVIRPKLENSIIQIQ